VNECYIKFTILGTYYAIFTKTLLFGLRGLLSTWKTYR
jgi:hypothetical protein